MVWWTRSGGCGRGLAEFRETVEGREGAGGHVGAAGLAAGAFIDEDKAVAERRWLDGRGVGLADMFDGHANGGVVERDFDGAEQDE